LYLSYNHRGDVVSVTSNTGARIAAYEHDAFGSALNPEPGTLRRIGFSSKEFDARSSLSHYGFRYYDAASGRWMTKDRLLWFGGLNLYRHAVNSPVGSFDIRGLFHKDIHSELSKHYPILAPDLDFARPDEKTFLNSVYIYTLFHIIDDISLANAIRDPAIRTCDVHNFERGVHFGQDYYGHKILLGISTMNFAGAAYADLVALPLELAGRIILEPAIQLGWSDRPKSPRSETLHLRNNHNEEDKAPKLDDVSEVWGNIPLGNTPTYNGALQYTYESLVLWNNCCTNTGGVWQRK